MWLCLVDQHIMVVDDGVMGVMVTGAQRSHPHGGRGSLMVKKLRDPMRLRTCIVSPLLLLLAVTHALRSSGPVASLASPFALGKRAICRRCAKG